MLDTSITYTYHIIGNESVWDGREVLICPTEYDCTFAPEDGYYWISNARDGYGTGRAIAHESELFPAPFQQVR